ncbi:GDYXXLXY domain-containing protein [Devosia sp.]|uniref:GDYXXLXY domain-containing protein n=1 Tax=Devosia sp. TaxID=1871048 RepID=UPI003A8E7A34
MKTTARLALIAAAMTAFLGFLVVNHATARAHGTEVVLDVRGYDPRDIFLGHFSMITTELQSLDASELTDEDVFKAGDALYVTLAPGEDGNWHPVSLQTRRPDSGVFIHGFVRSSHTIDSEWTDPQTGDRLDEPRPVHRVMVYGVFNIERYYASRELALAFERRLRERDSDGDNGVRLILSLSPGGNAIIKGFEIDGVRQIDRLW